MMRRSGALKKFTVVNYSTWSISLHSKNSQLGDVNKKRRQRREKSGKKRKQSALRFPDTAQTNTNNAAVAFWLDREAAPNLGSNWRPVTWLYGHHSQQAFRFKAVKSKWLNKKGGGFAQCAVAHTVSGRPHTDFCGAAYFDKAVE